MWFLLLFLIYPLAIYSPLWMGVIEDYIRDHKSLPPLLPQKCWMIMYKQDGIEVITWYR